MEKATAIKVKIHTRLMPDYYAEFQCIAEACQDSCCCYQWEIPMNKSDYLKVRNIRAKGALAEALDEGLCRIRGERIDNNHYAEFRVQEGRCPVLSEEGLCRLQATYGHQVLPKVCQTFPRGNNYTAAGRVDVHCSTACEAVLQLLYQRKDGLGFCAEAIPAKKQGTATLLIAGELEADFAGIQELCIDILQDRTMTIPLRLLVLGWVLRDLPARSTGEQPWNGAAWLAERRALSQSAELREQLDRLPGNQTLFALNNMKQFQLWSNNTKELSALFKEASTLLELTPNEGGNATEFNIEKYQLAEVAFQKAYGDLDYFFENMMVNIFFQRRHPIGYDGIPDIWADYITLCNTYGALRFWAISCCQGDGDLPRLFHVLTIINRATMHNAKAQKMKAFDLTQHGNDTLADMAVLVRG